jgi:hypothetical protein
MTERFPSDGENRLGGMRILTAFLAFIAILGLLADAVVALAGGLVPPRQRPAPPRQRPAAPPQRPVPPRERPEPPRHRPLPGGWVYVPVWVGPPPQPAMPVIEAEFVSDPRRG